MKKTTTKRRRRQRSIDDDLEDEGEFRERKKPG